MDGRIYATAGNFGSAVIQSVEIYDPATDKWQQGPDFSQPRFDLSAVGVEGKVYVLGGMSGKGARTDVWKYDPESWPPTFSVSLPLPTDGLQYAYLNAMFSFTPGGGT
jgi:hypothetical protein